MLNRVFSTFKIDMQNCEINQNTTPLSQQDRACQCVPTLLQPTIFINKILKLNQSKTNAPFTVLHRTQNSVPPNLIWECVSKFKIKIDVLCPKSTFLSTGLTKLVRNSTKEGTFRSLKGKSSNLSVFTVGGCIFFCLICICANNHQTRTNGRPSLPSGAG